MQRGAEQQAEAPHDIPSERRPVEDGTAYWTLSFYISRAQIEQHDLALPLHPAAFGLEDTPHNRHWLAENFNMARYFVDQAAWSAGGAKSLANLRNLPRFDARDRVAKARGKDHVPERTAELRRGVNPLFNDIADRSRLGRIEDQLFAVEQSSGIEFVLPEFVNWSTEGRTYRVKIDPPGARYKIHVTRFWYLHGNGAMSWHVSFEVRYRDDAFDAALAKGTVPTGLYLLSLMQKLAYPKESEVAEGNDAVRSDELFALRLCDPAIQPDPLLFWNTLYHWFEKDKAVIGAVHDTDLTTIDFPGLNPHIAINEIPGLFCFDTRSNFFIKDEQFFRLIQPKDSKGNLEPRGKYVTDLMFDNYPALIDEHSEVAPDPDNPKGQIVTLGPTYWQAMLQPGAGNRQGKAVAGSSPANRLLYLFLAGFNQNIIDWTNQDASEVLDSLDPIYPSSAEQLEEGFFIRYANPRCLISYVQRSRTLEVGNDFIGTCPYAFLIHVLAMHNERLTRDQEKLAFAVVEKVNSYLHAAEGLQSNAKGEIGKLIRTAEEWINWYRIAAFEHFDRHRYFNPFRYDTERDTFDALEKLRGTSRLASALDKAFAALDESTRDLERVRADAEADAEETRSFALTVVFGALGIAGVAQVVLQVDDLFREEGTRFTALHLLVDLGFTAIVAAGLAALVALPVYLFGRR